MLLPVVKAVVYSCLATIARAHASNSGRDHEQGPSINDGRWVTTWAAMPQLTEPANLPPPPYNGSNVVFLNSTLRQTLRMSSAAEQIRIRISNAFGGSDLPITGLTVALPFNGSAGVSAIQSDTLQTVTFSGNESTLIPNGALAVSDPINLRLNPGTMLSVTLYTREGQGGSSITSHPGSRTTSWFTMGNQLSSTNLTGPLLNSTAHWYFISAVEAWTTLDAGSLAIVGDSITDGRGSTTDANNRWPDLLLGKLQANPSTTKIAIANQAAGGNRILADGLGPNALSRIDRDVLSQSGVKYAMIFEGVNDIGVASADHANQSIICDRIISAYDQIITRVHAHRIPIFGATITPFSGQNSTLQPYSDPIREETRQQINSWIRNSGRFDEVIDFDQVLADPEHLDQLNPLYDSGDYLHPNPAGYQALADAFPLEFFAEYAGGISGFV